MVPELLPPVVLCYSARTAASLVIDLAELHPIPVSWLHDSPLLLLAASVRVPHSRDLFNDV
jgi:hypothetical protein